MSTDWKFDANADCTRDVVVEMFSTVDLVVKIKLYYGYW